MIIKKILLPFFVIGLSLTMHAQNEEFLNYIDKYKDIAVREMQRAGIPASIKLAQGLLESNAGKSYLARNANNHFGMKCGDNWKGKKVYRKDDDFDENGKLIKSCFRGYKSVEAGYIAHSEFLRDPRKYERYGFLFRYEVSDYRRWAIGLKKAGYATSGTYHTKLINLIETYNLNKYDRMNAGELAQNTQNAIAGVLLVNDVKYVNSESTETLADIANRTLTSLRSLIKYNEHIDDGNQVLDDGTQVFIQPKRNAYRGREKMHYVQKGDSMFSISQRYGVKLKKLYKRNRIAVGNEPAVNQPVKLRGWKVKKAPLLRTDKQKEAPPEPEEEMLEMEEEMPELEEIDIEVVKDTSKVIPEVEEETETLPEIVPQDSTSVQPPKETKTEEDKNKEKIDDAFGEEEKDLVEEVKEEIKPAGPNAIYHTVQKDDTLWNISKRYKTTIDNIKKLNRLNSDNIKLGQKLRVK